jgi:hypothetical protein
MTTIHGWLNLVKINDAPLRDGLFLCLAPCQAHETASWHVMSLLFYSSAKLGGAEGSGTEIYIKT